MLPRCGVHCSLRHPLLLLLLLPVCRADFIYSEYLTQASEFRSLVWQIAEDYASEWAWGGGWGPRPVLLGG